MQRYARAARWQDQVTLRPRRSSILDPHADYLQQRWQTGNVMIKDLQRELQVQGINVSYTTLRDWITHTLPPRQTPEAPPPRPPIVRQVTGWFTRHPDTLSQEETRQLTLAATPGAIADQSRSTPSRRPPTPVARDRSPAPANVICQPATATPRPRCSSTTPSPAVLPWWRPMPPARATSTEGHDTHCGFAPYQDLVVIIGKYHDRRYLACGRHPPARYHCQQQGPTAVGRPASPRCRPRPGSPPNTAATVTRCFATTAAPRCSPSSSSPTPTGRSVTCASAYGIGLQGRRRRRPQAQRSASTDVVVARTNECRSTGKRPR